MRLEDWVIGGLGDWRIGGFDNRVDRVEVSLEFGIDVRKNFRDTGVYTP